MRYIIYKRFKAKAICGDVNLPAMTKCETIGDMILYGDMELCSTFSANAHQYFANDEDGQGMIRGKLIQKISKQMKDNRVDSLCHDTICQQYRRKEHHGVWLWNQEFYNAPIEDLHHIAQILGVKTK